MSRANEDEAPPASSEPARAPAAGSGGAPAVLEREALRRWPQTGGARAEATLQAARLVDARLRHVRTRICTAPKGSATAAEQRQAAEAVERELAGLLADLLVGNHFREGTP